MASPAANFSGGMPGEPTYGPVATSGKAQPTTHGPRIGKTKKVTVKAHTRTVVAKPKVSKPAAAPIAPVNPDQALIDAAVSSHYGPQEQALNQQVAQNTRYTSGLGDWYKNALDEIRGLQGAQAAAAQQRLTTLTNYASPATLANPNDQQAANARNNLQAEFAGKVSSDAGANADAITHLAAVLALQQGNTVNQANAQKQNLLGQQGALGQQKADYGLTYGSQLASAEQKAANDAANLTVKQQHENAYEGIAKNAGLLKEKTLNQVQIPLAKSLSTSRTSSEKVARTNARIKRDQLKEKKSADDKALQIKTDAANTKATGDSLKRSQFIAKYGLTPEQVAKKTPGQLSHFATQHPEFEGYTRAPAAAKAKPLTQGQAKGRQGLLDAITRYQTGVKHGEALHKIADDGRKNKVNEAVLHAGADAVSHGYITPPTVALLEQIGYSVPKQWTKPGAFPVTYKAGK